MAYHFKSEAAWRENDWDYEYDTEEEMEEKQRETETCLSKKKYSGTWKMHKKHTQMHK